MVAATPEGSARTASRTKKAPGSPRPPSTGSNAPLRDDQLTAGDLVVVDEAGMVGTRSLLRLIEEVSKAQAKVVLIGDPRQLPELDAGGAFGSLTRRHRSAKLTTNRRQDQAWERGALGDLRHGDSDTSFAAYLDHQADETTSREHASTALSLTPSGCGKIVPVVDMGSRWTR